MDHPFLIFPKPQKIIVNDGSFALTANSSISCSSGGEIAADVIKDLTELNVIEERGIIRFEFTSTIQGEEAYRLDIDEGGIQISASTPAGLFYGAQTLRQMLPAEVEEGTNIFPCTLPYIHIEDEPRFPYRGFMLDVSRYFFNVEEIKRVIDLLALLKINRFHWNLTNDQGWRIQIKRYPLLTEIGSIRKESQIGGWFFGKRIYDGKSYGGFYTQEDVREIVEYARKKYIEVIPEIDFPGHAAAAIAAYPELSCSGTPSEVIPTLASFSRPVCAGKEFVYEFLENVYSEIVELFPHGFIHIGGDEVNKKEWKKCPHCQLRMKADGLRNENDLQTYFENRLFKTLRAKDSRIIVWNDGIQHDLALDVINQFWLTAKRKKTIAELQKGRKTIISDFSALYLDYPYKTVELIRTYNFEPQFPKVTDEQAANLMGIEAALWTEYVSSCDRMDWQLFPRLLAVSEIAWTPRNNRDYQEFLTRLRKFEKRLDFLGVHHATRECYMKYQKISRIPPFIKMFTREHPAMTEYKKFHSKQEL